jgi:hypothetical protein
MICYRQVTVAPDMDRLIVHNLPKAMVAARLRAMGFHVEVQKVSARYDMLLNGTVRLALRTASLSTHQHRVQVGTRRYAYCHRRWNFNFHHHGRLDDRYCDVFVCLPLVSKRPNLGDAYVIPWEACTAKVFSLPDMQHPYTGQYAKYRGAWEQLAINVRRPTDDQKARRMRSG